jgi:phospholipase/carboxylesterase
MKTNVITKGELVRGRKLLVMVHGRGASAEDILSLAAHLPVNDFTLTAPQAPGNTWYPYSFIAPQEQNQPHLDNSLEIIDKIVKSAQAQGIANRDIIFLGFSQGACLSLEYVTRNARRWGGVIAFTGGLIGDKLEPANYSGDFNATPIYIGTSDPDPHVPVSRVRETEKILKTMNANIKVDVFANMGHTIIHEELKQAGTILQLTKNNVHER